MDFSPEKKSSSLILIHSVFLSAIIFVRVLFDLYLPALPPFSDTETYELLALELLNGMSPSYPVRPLGYPLFITAIYKLFGISRDYVIYAHQLLGVLSYFLYYSIFRIFFKKNLPSVVLAFLISISSTVIFYEKFVLSDFLNHFFFLSAIYIYLKFYRGKKLVLLVPLSLISFAAAVTRPNSIIFPALIVLFLVIQSLKERKKESFLFAGKGISVFILTFFIFKAGFDFITVKTLGFSGKPVGVLGVTALTRVSDFIDYDSGLHQGIKNRYGDLKLHYLNEYDPASADHMAGYRLMVEIECGMSPEERMRYVQAADNSERFFGRHEVNSRYFHIIDVLRELKCSTSVIDKAFKEVALEAVLSDPIGYSGSVLLSIIDFASVRPTYYYTALNKKIHGSPLTSGILSIYIYAGNFLENFYTTIVMMLIFFIGATSYFIDKKEEDRFPIMLLTLLLCVYYLSIAALNTIVPRYKLPLYWIEFFLFIIFTGSLFKRASGLFRKIKPVS